MPVSLKEFELLRILMLHADRVVTNEEIGLALWGDAPSAPSANAIKVHIRRLRRHLGDESMVRTVRGMGYTLSHLRSAS